MLEIYSARYDFQSKNNEKNQINFYLKNDVGVANWLPLEINQSKENLTFEKVKEKEPQDQEKSIQIQNKSTFNLIQSDQDKLNKNMANFSYK